MTTSHNLIDSVGYGPPVLHAADAGVATAVHAVSFSPFGRVCYGAAGLAFAAGVLPQAAGALLPTLWAAVRAARREVRRAPPVAPWLMVSVLLYVVGKAHGAPHGGADYTACRGVPPRGWPQGGLLGMYDAAEANVSAPYVGVLVALTTVLWTVDTASEVMVVGRAAYEVARVLDRETDRTVVTPSGDVVVADAVVAIEVVVGGVSVVLGDVLLLDEFEGAVWTVYQWSVPVAAALGWSAEWGAHAAGSRVCSPDGDAGGEAAYQDRT